MRTTVTLDPDVAAALERRRRERGVTFKEAINDAVRAGLSGHRQPREYRLRTFRMGVRPGIDLDKALQLDAALQDEEIIRKLRLRK